MSERTIEEIRAELADLKRDSVSTAAVVTQLKSQPVSCEKSAYADSFFLACTVIGFGVFVLICVTYLIKKDKQIDSLLRPFGTILIIISAVFLIIAGFSEQQISPVIGLLGTIAGYVLGKDTTAIKNKDYREQDQSKLTATEGLEPEAKIR